MVKEPADFKPRTVGRKSASDEPVVGSERVYHSNMKLQQGWEKR